MKTAIALALISLSAIAAADESTPHLQPTVEEYDYSTKLDIARVISSTPVPNVCGVAPMKMTYEDSQGRLHIMSYLIMGDGCPD